MQQKNKIKWTKFSSS